MENELRAKLIAWLLADPELAGLNAVEEESPLRATPPWLGIAASAATDWGSKDRLGREVRIALELVTRGDDPSLGNTLAQAIETRVTSIPADQTTFTIVTARFLRSRTERRSENMRAALIEFRFRILATQPE
jgi:hypothetical protein